MRVVLTGASGRLGSRVSRELKAKGFEAQAWTSNANRRSSAKLDAASTIALDLGGELPRISDALDSFDPEVVFHAGAVSSAAVVHSDFDRGWRVNVVATQAIADWCRKRQRRLVFTSTDMVFSGEKAWWNENDQPSPILDYGRTKQAAEQAVLSVPNGLVVRYSLLFGFNAAGMESFFDLAFADIKNGNPKAFYEDEFRTPLDMSTASKLAVELVSRPDVVGILHAGGRERVSRFKLMKRSAGALGFDESRVHANTREPRAPGSEPRPADLSLDTTRLEELFPKLRPHSIEEAVLSASF